MGKTALVTGASSGIGLELSRVLAREGYDLILVARNEERLKSLAAELERQGVGIRVIAADLSQPGVVPELYAQTRDTEIEVLVNNAGFGTHGRFADSDWAREEGMLRVNILALTHLTRLYLPNLVRRGRGRILNVASIGAYQPGPGMAVYCATKAYVLSFSEALAVELGGTGVTVTTLCPGATRTSFPERAAVGDTPLFQFGVMEAAAVARAAYQGLRAGRTVVVPGFQNRVMTGLAKVLPHSFLARVSHAMLTPKA